MHEQYGLRCDDMVTGELASWLLDTRHEAGMLCGDAPEPDNLAGHPHDDPDLDCHSPHAGFPPLPAPQGAGQAPHPTPVWLHIPLLPVRPTLA